MLTPETQTEPLAISDLAAIDCDVHPRSPVQADLMPHLDAYWRDMFPYRDIDRLELTGYPISTKPYMRPDAQGATDDVDGLRAGLLDPLTLDAAILNVVNGTQAVYDPYMASALCRATNRWLVAEWLDRDPRLRASLVVPFQNPEAAVEEIRAYAGDKRFVQILAVVMGDRPLGQRLYWPIYEAAVEHGFALSIHPGSAYRHAPTQSGFPSYLVEEHVAWTQGFANQITSLLAEGVFGNLPDLKVVLAESGVSWMFGMTWRVAKDWRGTRIETPWVKDSPHEIIERHVRLTTQPFDGPPPDEDAEKVIDCVGSEEMLLFSTDFPHDYGDDLTRWPAVLPRHFADRICRDNVLATYPRLELSR